MTETADPAGGLELLVYRVGALAAVAAGIGALFTSNEVETTLLMVGAVIAGLLCFDVSMERRLRSRLPWLFVSLAPTLKTAPLVWFELREDNGLLLERYDHAGTLLFGLCLMAAVVALSRPAPVLGSDVAAFDLAVVTGTAAIAATAGASVGYLFDRDFGSETAARLLETPTWFVVGALLAAVTLAAAHAAQPTPPLGGLLLVAGATAGLLAFSVAGGTIDRGWWAVLFAGLAVSAAALGPARLGERETRTRRSIAGVVVAIVAGLVAAAAAITARSDPSTWGPGWAILGILALAMFALAMASKPIEQQHRDTPKKPRRDRSIAQSATFDELDLDSVQAQTEAKERALAAMRSGIPDTTPTKEEFDRELLATQVLGPIVEAEPLTSATATGAQAVVPEPQEAAVPKPQDVAIPTAQAAPNIAATPQRAPTTTHEPDRVQSKPALTPEPAKPRGSAQPRQAPPVDAGLSDARLVASARAAAEVRQTPAGARHGVAPVQHAHHFDPSTGLLSAAGLQQALSAAFSTPRQAGHVTMMMFTIRDLDEIENAHGRLASAAVTREIAERVQALLPAGTAARFARAAYAIVFVGDLGPADATVQSLARALLHLRAPLSEAAVGARIDVVAGMAQCYEHEEVSSFVQRANAGLARAVQTPEATFVAMP